MVQAKNPYNSAKATAGEYAGLLFRFLPINKSSYSVNFNINYRYSRTQGSDANQETRFTWHETVVNSEIQFHATEKVKFSLAAEYQLIDGIKRDNGNNVQIDTFEAAEKTGLRSGVHLTIRPTEVIGFEWSSGYKNGAKLYFSRQF